MWRAFVVVIAAAAGLVVREAHACSCGYGEPRFTPPRFHGEPLELQEEGLSLRCEAYSVRYVACRWQATYRLHNPGAGRTIALTVAHPVGEASLGLDGAVVAANPAPAALEVVRYRSEPRELTASWDAPAGGTTTLTVDARFVLEPNGCGCSRSTNERRHLFVSRTSDSHYAVHYEREVARFSRLPATFTIVQDIPARWQGALHGDWRDDPAYVREDRRKVAAATLPVPQERGERAWMYQRVGLTMERRPRFGAGGPIVGVGLGWSPEGVQARLRGGWEVALPKWLVHSLVVETDARRRVAVVPAWELAFPYWGYQAPEISAGVGVPVQLVPEARPGVRVHGRFGWWFCSVVGAFDHFPAVRGLPRERLGSLMLQIGF